MSVMCDECRASTDIPIPIREEIIQVKSRNTTGGPIIRGAPGNPEQEMARTPMHPTAA